MTVQTVMQQAWIISQNGHLTLQMPQAKVSVVHYSFTLWLRPVQLKSFYGGFWYTKFAAPYGRDFGVQSQLVSKPFINLYGIQST